VIRVWPLALCAVFLYSGARAETVNLDQAVDQALNHDPRIEEVQHLVNAARAQIDEAQGHKGWTIDLNSFLGVAPAVSGNAFSGGACQPGSCELRRDRYDFNGLSLWADVTFSVVKPLYTFGKIENYTKAAEANVEVKQGDVSLKRGEIVLDVKRAYYGYLAAHDGYLLLTDVKNRVDGTIELVKQWLQNQNGNVRQSDLYALQSGSALIGRYIDEAEALQKVALDGLKILTGAGLDSDLSVADRGLRPVDMPDMDLSALEKQALAQRPEMAQVEAGLRARRALVAANKANAKPNLYAGVGGLFAYSPNRDTLDNPYIYDPFNDAALSPVIGLKWDWTSGVQSAQVAQAEAELNALIAKAAQARQGIPFQVAEQYHQVNAYHDAVAHMADASRSARRWMIASFADFEAGQEKGDKVVTAFQGYVLAHTQYLQTVFDYNMHVAQLLRVTGVEQ